MKLSGTEHPADAVRKEIDKMRSALSTSEESIIEDTPPTVDDTADTQELAQLEVPTIESTFSEPITQEEVPREQTVEYWKHRFDVIQGKYHAETAELRNQVSSLKDTLDDVLTKPQISQPQTLANTLDNLEEEYGEEFSNALNSRIQSLVNAELSRVNTKVEQEINSVRQVQAQNEEQLFQDSIAKFVPNWVSINTDPVFIDWLDNNVEPFSGFNFMSILRNAYSNRDLDKVTKIFQTFIDATRRVKQQNQQPQISQEQASMITPPKRGSVANNTLENNSGKVFTQSEIQEFYRKLSAGDFKGKDEYVRQTKLAILQANAEGRII